MELPGMTDEALLDEKERESWGPVVNLDIFFTDMYSYFMNRGLTSIITSQICSVLSLGFTVAFSVFLIAYVDWGSLMECYDELSCSGVGSYIVENPFPRSGFGMISFGYLLLFSVFWAGRTLQAVQAILHAIEMSRFYRYVKE